MINLPPVAVEITVLVLLEVWFLILLGYLNKNE